MLSKNKLTLDLCFVYTAPWMQYWNRARPLPDGKLCVSMCILELLRATRAYPTKAFIESSWSDSKASLFFYEQQPIMSASAQHLPALMKGYLL